MSETTERSIVFERDNADEPALVVSFKNLHDLDHPKIQEILRIIGVPALLFGQLLKREFNPSEVNTFSIPNEKGVIKEDIEQQILDTPYGKIEVSDCKLYRAAVTGLSDIGLHLRTGANAGFEAILALSGKATLTFPERAEPIGGDLYFGSKKRKSVEMTPGTLAIIPAPTASGWTDITGDVFEFRYICLPPWSPNFVRPVQ